jgi:UPF0716 protein FxsA
VFFVLIAFLAVPVVEIALFIQVGGWIGLWPTLALIVFTAVLGTYLLRQQGLATLARARASMSRHEFPVNEVFDGACLLFAGALLLTPGFLTDAVGALLLLPPFRNAIRGPIVRRIFLNVVWQDPASPGGGPNASTPFRNGPFDGSNNDSRNGPQAGPTLEGEFQDMTKNDGRDNRPGD